MVAKHCISHLYCAASLVHETFMDRFKADSWDEKDERKDKEFLEIEKECYVKIFLHVAELVPEDNECEGDD